MNEHCPNNANHGAFCQKLRDGYENPERARELDSEG